ncbi:hypothetical protein SAMN05216371_3838 [Streptomyces sp. TLI_053]|uniref:hypothetical protein n=1 Tax=Streptomyces sp. TLI_053 TaxID=1855352 RepID=UPI000879847E|nr:hypothetical protein [Streptomyces sp. TLI_053]SDT69645.1 hypothetical protein SAMN05216371_3838 [Streptomyces sp. TLI_053]
MKSRHRPGARHPIPVSVYRLTATWPGHARRPALFETSDRRQFRRVAREYAAAGAVVLCEESLGYGRWRVVDRLDGPALLRAQREAELAARRAEVELLAERRRDEQRAVELAAVEAVMVQPPIPRDGGRPRARTVARGRGIR